MAYEDDRRDRTVDASGYGGITFHVSDQMQQAIDALRSKPDPIEKAYVASVIGMTLFDAGIKTSVDVSSLGLERLRNLQILGERSTPSVADRFDREGNISPIRPQH